MSEVSSLGKKRKSITSVENRNWLRDHEFELDCYLDDNHQTPEGGDDNYDVVRSLIFWDFPDEGRKLIENQDLVNYEKLMLIVRYIFFTRYVFGLILGGQQRGKDVAICMLFEELLIFCKGIDVVPPRIVTLGSVKCPPFVLNGEDTDFKYYEKYYGLSRNDLLEKYGGEIPDDMYFSIEDLPVGSAVQSVYVYCTEMESEFPSREFASKENKLFTNLEGTLAQNYTKWFGCTKLSAKVDISSVRASTLNIFKFIESDKLDIEGAERRGYVSPLARWLLPSRSDPISKTLFCFQDNLFTVDLDLPSFWTKEYSEQFRGDKIPLPKVYSYIRARSGDYESVTSKVVNDLRIMVIGKFRQKLTPAQIREALDLVPKT